MLANTKNSVLPRKWHNEMGDIDEKEYLIICKQLRDIQDIKLKDFQYKLNGTKTFLGKINIVENDLCSYCNDECETIKNLFLTVL